MVLIGLASCLPFWAVNEASGQPPFVPITQKPIMDLEARLAAIEKTQNEILQLLAKNSAAPPTAMTLKEAAEYVGFSVDHFRRLSVERRLIPYSRPSGQQKGKIVFRKIDLDRFLEGSLKEERTPKQPGRKRKSPHGLFF